MTGKWACIATERKYPKKRWTAAGQVVGIPVLYKRFLYYTDNRLGIREVPGATADAQ